MASIHRKENGKYLVQVRAKGSPSFTATVATKEEATELAAAKEVQARRVRHGVFSRNELAFAESERKLTVDHLGDWRRSLLDNGSKVTHVDRYHRVAKEVIEGCGFERLSQLEHLPAAE